MNQTMSSAGFSMQMSRSYENFNFNFGDDDDFDEVDGSHAYTYNPKMSLTNLSKLSHLSKLSKMSQSQKSFTDCEYDYQYHEFVEEEVEDEIAPVKEVRDENNLHRVSSKTM